MAASLGLAQMGADSRLRPHSGANHNTTERSLARRRVGPDKEEARREELQNKWQNNVKKQYLLLEF